LHVKRSDAVLFKRAYTGVLPTPYPLNDPLVKMIVKILVKKSVKKIVKMKVKISLLLAQLKVFSKDATPVPK